MFVQTPSQHEMTGRVKSKVDPQKQTIVANIPYVDATNDNPFLTLVINKDQ